MALTPMDGGFDSTPPHSEGLTELAIRLLGKLKPLFWDEEKKILIDSDRSPVNAIPRGYPIDLAPSFRQGLAFTVETVLLYANRFDADAYCRTPNVEANRLIQFYKML